MAFYLITGGAGFIGSSLCEKLLEKGHKVRIIDNFFIGKEENISCFKNDIEIIRGDIRNSEEIRQAVKGVDYVMHMAALSSVAESIEDPTGTGDVNIDGTLNVLLAARDEGVKRVVLASSAAVYGDSEAALKIETMPTEPISPYAVSKCVGELYAKVFCNLYNIETVCLRYFNVFGPKQDPTVGYAGVISRFIWMMKKDQAPVIFGDGCQSRDFIYVEDISEASILASISDKTGKGEAINIASGQSITLNQLMETINVVLGKELKPVYKEARKGDIRHSLADVTLAKRLLGFEYKGNIMQDLIKTI